MSIPIHSEIRAECARRNLSVRRLCAMTGISQNSLYLKMNGKRTFYIDELEKIADTFNLKLWELVKQAEEGSNVSS